jgi:hypothetical protein
LKPPGRGSDYASCRTSLDPYWSAARRVAAIIVLGAALELVLQSYARGRDWTRTSAD